MKVDFVYKLMSKVLAIALVGALFTPVSFAKEALLTGIKGSAMSPSSISSSGSSIVFYRGKGNSNYVPTIFVNGHVVTSLLPEFSARTMACDNTFSLRVDTRSGAVATGDTQSFRSNVPVVYFRISELSNNSFIAQQVDESTAVRELAPIQALSHVINRNLPNCQPKSRVLRKISLGADALFVFGKSEMLPTGYAQLDNLVADVQKQRVQIGSLNISGHTDFIGNDMSNMNLSRARAEAVKQYLNQRGLNDVQINTEGRGESQPVTTTCQSIKNRAAQIACLQPDRRVEIELMGVSPEDAATTVAPAAQ